jgi:hypothetical protein
MKIHIILIIFVLYIAIINTLEINTNKNDNNDQEQKFKSHKNKGSFISFTWNFFSSFFYDYEEYQKHYDGFKTLMNGLYDLFLPNDTPIISKYNSEKLKEFRNLDNNENDLRMTQQNLNYVNNSDFYDGYNTIYIN